MIKLIVKTDNIEKEVEIGSFEPVTNDLVREDFENPQFYLLLLDERKDALGLYIGRMVLKTIEELNYESNKKKRR